MLNGHPHLHKNFSLENEACALRIRHQNTIHFSTNLMNKTGLQSFHTASREILVHSYNYIRGLHLCKFHCFCRDGCHK